MESFIPVQRQRSTLPLSLLLTTCYLILRLPNLRDMPVFTDEATYIRWTQSIIADPLHNLFVSMQDAKLPLHYWLLAIARPLAADPLTAGRLLSVLLGALTIPIALLFAREFWQLHPSAKSNPTLFPAILAAFLITNPLIAMNQRLALAESLLLLEAITLAWLSLRLARQIVEEAPRPSVIRSTILLSLTWAAALLTKQNSSYALWILPPMALLAFTSRPLFLHHLRRFLPMYALATIAALALFIPVLFTDSTFDLHTRLFYKPVFQNHTIISNWVIARENITDLLSPRSQLRAQWWPHDPLHPLEEGWFYLYLTPPLFALVPVSLLYMTHRRQWKPLLFIAIWSASQLVPLIALAGVLFSRYTLLGFFPLLILPAWLLADLLPRVPFRLPTLARATATAAIIALLLAWPAAMCAWSAVDWRAPTLTKSDAGQLRNRFSSGTATEQAIDWFQHAAQQHPITIITGHWVGLPNDMLAVAFAHNPNVQLLHWHDGRDNPLHPLPGCASTYLLSTDRWVDHNERPLTLDPTRPTYLLSPAMRDPDTELMNQYLCFENLPPGTHLISLFVNTPDSDTGFLNSELRLLEIPVPPPALAQQ